MSDFESTANAAVTKLQEIDEIMSSTRPKIEAADDNLQAIDDQFSSLAEQLLETLDAIEQGIQSAREQQQEVAGTILERLGTLKEHAHEVQSKSTEELGGLKEISEELASHGQQIQETLQTQLAAVQSGMAEAKSALESAQQQASSVVDQMKSNIDESVTTLGQRVEEIGTATSDTQQAITQEVLPALRQRLEAAQEVYDEMQTQLESHLTETRDSVDRSANDLLDQVTGQYDDRLQEAVSKAEQFAETIRSLADKAMSAGDTMVSTKQVMDVAMKSTNVGLESVVDTLRNIKEIFEKIV